MSVYLVTFSNIFECAQFKATQEQYFSNIDEANVIFHNSKFCEVHSKKYWNFNYSDLKKEFPNTKILLKHIVKNKLTYKTVQ